MVESEYEYVAGASDLTATVTSLSDGRSLESTIDALAVIKISMGGPGRRYRSLRITPFGTGSDNNQFTLRVYGRTRTGAVKGKPSGPTDNGQASPDGDIKLIGTLVCTLCTKTGVSGGVVGTGYRFADTLAWTSSTLGGKLETAYGVTITAHSPADNTPGFLEIPDAFGFESIILEPTMTSATAANALVLLQT